MTIALITGAASGIGAAIARRVAAPSMKLMLHTRKNADGLATVAADAVGQGAVVKTVLADLAAPESATEVINATISAFGGLDWLVANAGFADKRPIVELPADGVAASFNPIANGFFLMAQAAASHLAASEQGRVVAVSSFVAHRFPHSGDLFPASAAAKAALEALAKALAAELSSAGITVNVVAPGYTQKDPGAHAVISDARWQEITERIPLGRLAKTDESAAAVAYFLSDSAGYVTGQTIHVDGGLGL
jgi:NAD(P)-dependent dehydrogenase (short-subunit alcohol dehydrogenase family)